MKHHRVHSFPGLFPGKAILKFAAFLFLSMLFTDCIWIKTRAGGLETSAKPLASRKYTEIEKAKGQSSQFNLFWFIPVTPRANFGKAIDEAIYGKQADNLVRFTWSRERQIWLLGTVDTITVNGIAIRYEQMK